MTVVTGRRLLPRSACRRCAHPWDAHQHFRRGTPCSTVACDCPRYRTRWWDPRSRTQLISCFTVAQRQNRRFDDNARNLAALKQTLTDR